MGEIWGRCGGDVGEIREIGRDGERWGRDGERLVPSSASLGPRTRHHCLARAAHAGVLWLRVEDLLVDVLDRVAPKGRQAAHHLVEHAAKRPPVDLISRDEPR